MKRTVIAIVVIAAAVAALAAFLVDWDPERTKREAFIYHCNEEGADGSMFTSRQYCEELYARSKKGGAIQNSN